VDTVTGGRAVVLRGDARALPLPDASVDLVVTSPPYWGLREYQDGGRPLPGQVGAEPDPAAYINALLDCTAEWVRVLKPGGSLFVNLADVYANTATPQRPGSSDGATGRGARPGRRTSAGTGVRTKSLYALPARYLIGCVDQLGLIARRDIIWRKTTALPESVTDRCATRHEYLFHLVTQEHYFAAVDTLRAPAGPVSRSTHPLGAMPGSVWDIAGEPLLLPGWLAHAACCHGTPQPGCDNALGHYAAFPTALPRQAILGWSPPGWCTGCGQPRRPRVRRPGLAGVVGDNNPHSRGEMCGCPAASAPTTPAVVVDPFGGTGTTALVAATLGRVGVSVDLSADYGRIARWRTTDPGQAARVLGVPKPAPQLSGQTALFGEEGV
jgi:site-specific DNA-methyltransferase (adenine-specific)